jgi:polysaccharide export outer membrane protein
MRKTICLPPFLLFIIIFFSLSSCIQQKQIAYFQKAANGSDTVAVAKAYVPKIQPGDILAIPVGSLSPLASSFFNPYSTMPVTTENPQAGGQNGNSPTGITTPLTQSSAPGYLVDASGNIEMPLIGSIKLAGLTTSEARDTLKNRLKYYLKEPTVNVRFLNYKISVMGEVLHPSVYVIPNETITLPEALSLAGDMTIYGVRNDVLVIRDENGKKVFGHVNLNSREVYNSPYYYLHANDIVYVEPGKGKIAQSDRTYQILPIILSALSFISIILVYSKR